LWPGYFADPLAAPPLPEDVIVAPEVNDALFADVARLFAERALEKGLPQVGCPALHVIGRYSPIDPSNNEATAALMPRGETELLDCGHFCWLEQPGSATAATRRLLAEL
jgi:pimeloyl-ACP methyl ester carboxylesterase